MNANDVPECSRELLNSAIRLLKGNLGHVLPEDMVMMIYNLGRLDGRMEQLDRDEEVLTLGLIPSAGTIQ